ncbi:hypothetical protein M0Q97_12615 [Candidatus Dojkabacteria bacterium]|jgi:hypothetical protein|nr:hypothetical protein [Candidatus Dojkabacteria bacterium]
MKIKKLNEITENLVSKYDFVDILKYKKTYYVKIQLISLQYLANNFKKLLDALNDIDKAGFKKFDTETTLGFYDSVDDINLEFIEDESKIDISYLIK